jgi:proline dehydrogenase
MINLEDTASAFAHKSKWELKKAYYLFSTLKYPSVVKLGSSITKFILAIKLPIKTIIKRTIFQQFCGGENIQDCEIRIAQLAKYGVGTILDYSVEGQESINDFENNKKEIIQTVLKASSFDNIPFSVFKVTGLGKTSLIRKLNQKAFELSKSEQIEKLQLINRIDEICKVAYENSISIFIDAEDSWYQDFIDEVAEAMILKYNIKMPIVYNTIQLYRHDRVDYMKSLISKCKSENLFLGLKLVRGAYMEKERQVALENGYKDPIHKTKIDTDKDYNIALKLCMDNLSFVSVCAGSHNEKSAILLTELMLNMGINNNDKRIYFAQLLGMSDHISFNLAKLGYNVAKYVPYGPIKEVLPYLIRRAEENTSVSGQTGRELSLIKSEIKRRSI